jgi:hypothetical protein
LNIDTNLDISQGSPQYDFIIEALQSDERKQLEWTFAYFHHPPYTEYWPQWDGDQRVRDHLVPLFEEHGVDMVFSGHTHSYEHGVLGNVHYLVAGGGGGNLDPFGRDFPHVRFSTAKHHFLRIDIDGSRLKMEAIDSSGEIFDSVDIVKQQSVSKENEPVKPEDFILNQNYPNPFNPQTTISFELAEPGFSELTIYNTAGQKVAVVLQDYLQAGLHTTEFDASNLNSGVYFYQLTTGDNRLSRKMVLLK